MLQRLYRETEDAYVMDFLPWQRTAKVRLATGTLNHTPIPTYIPDQHIAECLIWLTHCDEHERGTNAAWIDWTGARIHAIRQETDLMMRRLMSLPGKLEEPNPRTAFVLMSGVRDVVRFNRLSEWWESRFDHPICVDFATTLAAARDSIGVGVQRWLVIPKQYPSTITQVSIFPSRDAGWSVRWSNDKEPYEAEDMEDFKAYVEERWILCAPIPEMSNLYEVVAMNEGPVFEGG
jgi:hypothetical protein